MGDILLYLIYPVIAIMSILAIALMIVQIVLMRKSQNIFIKLIPVYIVGGMLIAIFVPGIFQISWFTENMHILFLSLTSPIYVFLSIPWLVIAVRCYLVFKNKNYNKTYDDNDF